MRYIIIGVIALGLCGCVINRKVVIEIKADNIKPTLGSYIPIEAENVEMKVTKESTYGTQKGD